MTETTQPLKQQQQQQQSFTNDQLTDNILITRKNTFLCCYSKESIDSRCCGTCYHLCPSKTVDDQCNLCTNTFCDYWTSGYIQSNDGYGKRNEDSCDDLKCDDCFCTTVCFPIKFPIFLPCFIGSLFNECVNALCGSNRNYLF
jgi:hypothetical protein